MSYTGYCDFYRNSDYRAFPQEHRGYAGRRPFQMVRVAQDAHDFSDPPVEETVIAMARKSGAQTWAWNMGNGWRSENGAAGGIMVLPPETASDWHVDGPRDVVLCVVPNATFRGVFGRSCPKRLREVIGRVSDRTLRDSTLESLLMCLWQASAGGNAYEQLHCEGLLTALLARLLALSGASDRKQVQQPAKLPRRVVEQVLAYAEAHLHAHVQVADLARVSNLSVRHFSRTFQNTVGDSPHRWLLVRRVSRAKELLSDDTLSLAEIALSCGFSSQAHLTTEFRHQTGTTPCRWRCERQAGLSG